LNYEIQARWDAIGVHASLKSPTNAIPLRPIAYGFSRRIPGRASPRHKEQTTKMALDAMALLVDFLKPLLGWPVQAGDSLVGEAVATASSAALESVLAIFRAHANPKAMGLLLVSVIGLERALHESILTRWLRGWR
jgi:hypothetical protein